MSIEATRLLWVLLLVVTAALVIFRVRVIRGVLAALTVVRVRVVPGVLAALVIFRRRLVPRVLAALVIFRRRVVRGALAALAIFRRRVVRGALAALVSFRRRVVPGVLARLRAEWKKLASLRPAGNLIELPPTRRLTLPELALVPGAPLVVLKKPPPTRHPIVLAHGYMGFASLGVHRARRDYFVGVRNRLEALGYTVHLARLSPAASISLRAEQLARQVESLRAERVNIIAHSMGGLDARYAITHLGLHDRVASLTTIGTPHRGTPLADTSTMFIGDWPTFRRMLDKMGANVDGLYDLTTLRMEQFNRLVTDVAGVAYASVIGTVNGIKRPVNPLLLPGHSYLLRTVGANDGMVPVESQKWGEVLGEIEADHWEQIGWSRSFDAQRFYAILVEHLAEWGF
jgi:triacylglycerol lipase